MPITSFKQFFEFLKFSFLTPFRLGWSIVGILLFGAVTLIIMFLFGYSFVSIEKIVSGDTVRIYGEPSLADRALEFFTRFIYEFIWQLWAGYIFVVVFVVDTHNKLIIRTTNELIKKYYKAICSLAIFLSVLFVLLPVASVSLGYRSEIYHLHYSMVYAIGVFFVFSLIEIIQKDKTFFDAMAGSILLLKGRYIFTFVVLLVLFYGLNYTYDYFYSIYYAHFFNVVYYSKKMAYVQGALKAVVDIIVISIYSGAVIYLYKIYSSQDSKRET